MIEATKKDRMLAVNILADAFEDNKSVNYVVRHGRGKRRRIKKLIAYSFDVCYQFGKVYFSDSKEACAMVLFPETKVSSLKTTLWDINLILSSFGINGAIKAVSREKIIHEAYPKDTSVYYLWFIGVSPQKQGRGEGSRLMKYLLKQAAIKDRTLLLETSTERNIKFYEKFGLKLYHQHEFSYTLYFFKK